MSESNQNNRKSPNRFSRFLSQRSETVRSALFSADPSAASETAEAEDSVPLLNLPVKQVRSHLRRGCLTSLVYAALILGISMAISAFLVLFVNEVFAFVKPDITTTIEITETDDFSSISEKLAEADIIKYPTLFNLYLNIAKSDITFVAGEYDVNAKLDYPAIVRALRKGVGVRETVRITIPEGYTTVQIVNLLCSKGVCTAQELYDVIENDSFDYLWLDQTGEGYLRLEGFLFPDTYEFYVDDDPHNVINKILSAFDSCYDADLQAALTISGHSLREIIIIASMVEREAYLDEERPVIASVIYNRLSSDKYPYLQIDATLAFILGRAPTDSELTGVDSPYNTYLCKGLPPSPIANPGLESIYAALYPENSDYYFYVARSDGSHIFSCTDEEHAAAIEEVQED